MEYLYITKPPELQHRTEKLLEYLLINYNTRLCIKQQVSEKAKIKSVPVGLYTCFKFLNTATAVSQGFYMLKY